MEMKNDEIVNYFQRQQFVYEPSKHVIDNIIAQYPEFSPFYQNLLKDDMGKPIYYFAKSEEITKAITRFFSPENLSLRSRWHRIVTFLENHNNIGMSELLCIPNSVWRLMVAPESEGKERWKNWEGLLGTCWGLRKHLMCLFDVEEPHHKYRSLLEGYYISCGTEKISDQFMKIKGNSVYRMWKSLDSRKERNDLYELRKVQLDKYIRIEMDINAVDDFGVSLPILIYQRSPPLPFPAKVLCDLSKVRRKKYQEMELKTKQFKPVMCSPNYGQYCNMIDSGVSLSLWNMVPKDYPERIQLMFAMPGIATSASTKLYGKVSEEEQKEVMINEMLKAFPSLSTIFNKTSKRKRE